MNKSAKTNFKQFLIVLGVLALMLAAIITPYAATHKLRAKNRARKVVELYSNVVVPKNAELKYKVVADLFQDGHIYYYVFDFDEEPSEFLKQSAFKKSKNGYVERELNGEWVKSSVSEDFTPNFDGEYYWQAVETNENKYPVNSVFAYFTDTKRLIMFINASHI